MKNNKFTRDDGGNALVGALVVVAIVFGAIAIGALVVKQPAATTTPQTFSTGPGGGVATPPPVVTTASLRGDDTATRDAMEAWNGRNGANLGQAIEYTFTVSDPTAGSSDITTGGFQFYEPTIPMESTNAPIFDQAAPGTTNTRRKVMAEGYYTVVYTDTGNTYYSRSYCDDEGAKDATPCQVPTKRTSYIQYPTWSHDWEVRRIGAFVDLLDESSTTDARGVQVINGQSNITQPEGASGGQSVSRCIVSSTLGAGARFVNGDTGTGAATNGNVLFFNNTACSGSFYVEPRLECGAVANRWCYLPALEPNDLQGNMTGLPFTSVAITKTSGSTFTLGATDATGIYNRHNGEVIPLYTSASPYIKSNNRDYIRIDHQYDSAVFAIGQCIRLYADDQNGFNEWLFNSSLTGGASQNIRICRSA